MSKSPIQVSPLETLVDNDLGVVETWRLAFAHRRAVYFPDILDPVLGSQLRRLSAEAQFIRQEVDRIGVRDVERHDRVSGALWLSLSRPPLLSWLSHVAGCGELRTATGVLARMSAGAGHTLGWHDDLTKDDRRLAVVVNLSTEDYQGGVFELREKGSETILYRHVHAGFGSALIFHVARDLEHRVSPVTSGGPRLVFAGWFMGARA
jgi:hypothetical protein